MQPDVRNSQYSSPDCSMAPVVSPGLPEPVRAGLDRGFARACDALESGKFPTFFRERFKPTLDFQAVTEARTIAVVDVVAADHPSRPGAGALTFSPTLPTLGFR